MSQQNCVFLPRDAMHKRGLCYHSGIVNTVANQLFLSYVHRFCCSYGHFPYCIH